MNSPNRGRHQLREISWVTAEQIARIFTNLFTSIWLVRHLGPSEFGIYAYVVTYVTFFAVLAKLGLHDIVVKELVAGNSSALSTAYQVKLTAAFTIYGLLAIGAFATESDPKIALYLCIAGFGLIFQTWDLTECYLQVRSQNRAIARAKALQNLTASGLKIALIVSGADVLHFVMVFAGESLLLAATYLYIARAEGIRLWMQPDSRLIKQLLAASWPLALSQFAMTAYTKVDQLMVFTMLGASHAGHYAAATKLSESWLFLPTLVAATLFPSLLASKAAGGAIYSKHLQRIYSATILIGVLIASVISAMAVPLVSLLYGAQFAPASSVLALHVWAGVVIAVGRVSAKWYVGEGLYKLFLFRSLAGLILNLGLNALLISRLGIMGAALATLLSVIAVDILFLAANRRTRWLLTVISASCRPKSIMGTLKQVTDR